MKRLMLLFITLFPVALFAGSTAAHDSKIFVEEPWARASIGTSRPTAAFMTIRNPSGNGDRLIKVSTPAAGLVELHQTRIKDGHAKMVKLHGITIPARGTVVLKPSSYHIMLMKLKSPIVKGTKLPLILTFEHGGTISVDAIVMGPGSGGHKHHH